MGGFPDPQNNLMFQVVPVFIMIGFVLVLGTIIFSIVRAIAQNANNAASPLVSERAKVVTKRISVSHTAGTTRR
jgi:hypothetical protein